ncbi:MAG: glycosyltransferase [Cyanobacteria bacterium]|nr:glycosyltransferase [Cyanobacteriota bacterium]
MNTFPLDLSIITPIYNEIDSLPHLLSAIRAITQTLPYRYEIICVDDGSTDGSDAWLRDEAQRSTDLQAVLLRRNYGQTAAMAAGFDHAQGRFIITLDADLQNDPADIPRLLDTLQGGYDLVSGWRKDRQDDAMTRLLPSKIANWIIRQVTNVRVRDYGCSLKAYRAELVADMRLYGELHRFLPALAQMEGARITDIPVRHHARKFGESKYGLGRTFRVVMDLLTIWFMRKFLTRPMHVFGVLGMGLTAVGFLVSLYLAVLKLAFGMEIGDRPLLILGMVMMLMGLQFFSFGLLAEVMMRTYHESQSRPIYRIREVAGARLA